MSSSSGSFTHLKHAFAVAALIAEGGLASASQAGVIVGEDEDYVVGQVQFADLDLSSAHDQQRLQSRVSGTIENMCTAATDGYGLNLLANRNMRACSLGAWNQARPQMERAIQRAAGRVALARSGAIVSAAIITIALPRK